MRARYPALWVSRNRIEECSIQRQSSWGWHRKTITESFISETIFVATIAGANAIGMKTVWINWSERRRKTPRGALEVPDKTVSAPIDLLVALDELYPSQGESQGATRQG